MLANTSEKRDAEFITEASPANILALLAERDADKTLIADSVVLFETLRQRITELEALTEEQDKRLITYAAIATKNASEARTVGVKLPRDITHVTNKYFEEGRDAVLEAIESQLEEAGIKLDVGE